MSANLLVDLGNTCDYRASLTLGSGASFTVGQIIDLGNANTLCNLFVAGAAGSGVIEVRVQTANDVNSGSFTDPTSGFAQFPAIGLASGGIYYANSGLWASGSSSKAAPVDGAPMFCSGGFDSAAFQRPGQYARLITNSGVFPNFFTAGLISQKRTTGSGFGSSQSPQSGTPSV